MRIAQVSHPGLRVPPKKYGGAELIIANLVNGLVKDGHQVTLFGTKDSETLAQETISLTEKPIGISAQDIIAVDKRMIAILTLYKALQLEKNFDIIHWHVSNDLMPVVMASFIPNKSVITFHNGFTSNVLADFYKTFYRTSTYVSISDASREDIPLGFTSTVYNGIELSEFKFSAEGKDNMVWLGRFSPVKGADLAMKVAIKLKKEIKIAAPNPQVPRQAQYFKEKVEPLLKLKNIEYIGEIGTKEKSNFLGNSKLLLNPIVWHEAFGLVVAEANACGTPVIAFARGSMPEIIKDGVNGFLVPPGNIQEMIKIAKKVYNMPEKEYKKLRLSSRDYAEKNFTVEKMTEGYLSVYKNLLKKELP